MEFLNKLLSIIEHVSNGENHKTVRQEILDRFEEFKNYNFEDENEYILCAGLFYNFFSCLRKLKQDQQKISQDDGKKTITMVDVYDTEKMYIENINYLKNILNKIIPEKYPDLKYEENNLSDAFLQISNKLIKTDKKEKPEFHDFLSFCSAYFSDNGNFHKSLSDYILTYYYMWTSLTTSSRKTMADFYEILSNAVDKRNFNILKTESFNNWIYFEAFWTGEIYRSFEINHVMKGKPFPFNSSLSASRFLSEILEWFLMIALNLDLYDYPGYYILLVQLIKEIDFNDFYKIFDDSKNLKEHDSISHDIYYKTTLMKLTGKSGLKFENFSYIDEEMKTENAGGWANFVRSIFAEKNSNNKICHYLSFFALWEMAADLKDSEQKKIFMEKFHDACLCDDWKNPDKLIELSNELSAEYKFNNKDCFTNLFTKKDLSPLEKEIRITEVYLLIRPADSCEGIQLSLINKLDKLRDEKLLCRPHSSIHYEITCSDDEVQKKKAEDEINRCQNNREKLQEMDKGFSYIYNDYYLSKKWYDTKTSWAKNMTCKLFHEPDKVLKGNANLNTPNKGNHYYNIKTFEDYNVENENCFSTNYLLLLRHLKTHGDHHVISNLLDDNNNKANFLITLGNIKKKLSGEYKKLTVLEEKKTVMFYLDCLDYIKNEFVKKLCEKNRKSENYYLQMSWKNWEDGINKINKNDCRQISFEQDFSAEFRTFLRNILNAIYSVQEDFMHKQKNQVNLYLCYLAESLIQYNPS